MNIVCCGVGRVFKRIFPYLERKNDNIVGIVDNNSKIWGSKVGNIRITSFSNIVCDRIDKFVITNNSYEEIKEQLIENGINRNDIISWRNYLSGYKEEYFTEEYLKNREAKERVLIFSTFLNYNGGTMAAIYAAQTLMNIGYDVIIATPGVDNRLLEESRKWKINIVVCPVLPYMGELEEKLILEVDYILVNVLSMVHCAVVSSRYKPTLWWIHEGADVYSEIIKNNLDDFSKINDLPIKICPVSKIPKKLLKTYANIESDMILPYGIPDNVLKNNNLKNRNEIVIAIIGNISELKGQDIFLEAMREIGVYDRNVSGWIIGGINTDEYSTKILEQVGQLDNIHYLGQMNRDEISEVYSQIDILVCPSRRDSLPIVVTEAMQHGKICIVSDAIGTVDYMKDGKNGFIFKSGNINDLKSKIMYVLNNYSEMDNVRKAARKMYEEFFSLEVLGERIISVFDQWKGI